MDGRLIWIKNRLKDKGYRATVGREEIIKLFLESESHYSANDIYDLVKSKNISISTVYRTLDILRNNGIIKEIDLNHTNYYELKVYSGQCIHIHCKCEKCNRLFDVYSPSISLKIIELMNKLEESSGFIVQDSSIIINGICSKCQKEVKPCQDQ